jgi:multidrug efflux pump
MNIAPLVARFTGARTFVTQQQTFGDDEGECPYKYVIQARNLDSLKNGSAPVYGSGV